MATDLTQHRTARFPSYITQVNIFVTEIIKKLVKPFTAHVTDQCQAKCSVCVSHMRIQTFIASRK